MSVPRLQIVNVGGGRLQTATWGTGPVAIVMLHDGLGSIGQWRDTPAEIAAATGTAVLAYERAGYGTSEPPATEPWPADWLHREAVVLGQLLEALKIEEPLVIGHSDGGTIALLHAAGSGSCSGVVALAAHSWVEPVCTEAITKMRQHSERYVLGLSVHHAAPAELFEAWSTVWTSNEFAGWDIRPMLHSVDVPALIAQGDNDQYATDAQLFKTAEAIGPNASVEQLAGVGHIIHHEQPAVVTAIVAEFYDHIQHQHSQHS